jgi:hypothetical protein
LSEVRLGRDGDELALEVPPADNLFLGEAVQRRLEGLARALGVSPKVRRCERRDTARG